MSISRWLIRLNIKQPNIVLQYNIKTYLNEAVETSFEYQNTTLVEKDIEFVTSHPELVHILKKDWKVEAGNKVAVPIVLKEVKEVIQMKVLVFAMEKSGTKHEALLFDISYIK